MPRITPAEVDGDFEGVMVTNASKLEIKQEQSTDQVNNSRGEISAANSVLLDVDYEKEGNGGVKESLGAYQRISVITCMLFTTCILLGLSTMFLLSTENADSKWQQIISGQKPFPQVKEPNEATYFDNRKILDIPVGKLIHFRKDWTHGSVDFGMDRDVGITWIKLGLLSAVFLCCLLHLTLSLCVKNLRRNFQLISLGYGFVGLLVFTIFLSTMYFTYVHKVSAYLQNAKNPPIEYYNGVLTKEDNQTLEYFVRMCFACAFAFSIRNRFAKDIYANWHYSNFSQENTSYTIENVTYTRDEMMDLGICPRQDFLLVAVFLLAITAIFCWMTASHSEAIENEIIGPPIWLQRFKVKIHKGIRHWETRKKIPSYLKLPFSSNLSRESADHLEDYHNEPLIKLSSYFGQHEKSSPVWQDAYDVLDGGMDHIVLVDPINSRGTSMHKLYHSSVTSTPPLSPR